MRWDPGQYARFSDHRGRPFHDLVARIGAAAPRKVIDLGCGSGELTTTLATRWPTTEVIGIDSSADMIEAAAARPNRQANIQFAIGDIANWSPAGDEDVIVSNAAFQWVPGHQRMLAGWLAALPPSTWFAFQVPGNFAAPSHALMRDLASSDRWRDRLGGVLRHNDAVAEPVDYAELFLAAGWQVDAWETTYLQLLQGEDAVLNWTRGTGLRPILNVLGSAEAGAFEAEYRAALDVAYPPTPHGTWFPFRRTFCVGHRPPTHA